MVIMLLLLLLCELQYEQPLVRTGPRSRLEVRKSHRNVCVQMSKIYSTKVMKLQQEMTK